jgi:hypothetical protein
MGDPVQNLHISCWSYNKYGTRQFLFVIGKLKKYSLKPFGQINWNLVGSTYGRFPQNWMKGEWHAQPIELLVYFTSNSLPINELPLRQGNEKFYGKAV